MILPRWAKGARGQPRNPSRKPQTHRRPTLSNTIMKIILLIIAAVVIGLLRPGIVSWATPMGFQIYKDLAHIFMGMLLVLWLTSWADRRTLWMSLFWWLNLVEVLSALHAKNII